MDEKTLIRAGGSTVTVRAFREAFESSITSPSLLFQDPDALRDKKYRILNRLSEELLILERARELDLKVSAEETANAINDLKNDYPDNTFEETLIENGITFSSWEKALKRRLLIEKVIRHDLSKRLFSTPLTLREEPGTDKTEPPLPGAPLLKGENQDTGNAENSPETGVGDNDRSEESFQAEEALSGIPAHTMAAEAKYPDWINRLKRQYGIEIDWKLWETIVKEQSNGV